jgi:peptidoglycan/LPS O-acetylase OafA/YrhL
MSTTYELRADPPSAGTTVSQPHTRFRPDIEGLRAVAVTLVVLSHAGLARFAGGYIGVDVFFVISGFLITTLLIKEMGRTGTISLKRFYARRATRLLPASTLVLVATLAASWLWLPSTRFRSISLDALFSTFYGINWRLAAEGTNYLNATAAPSPLQDSPWPTGDSPECLAAHALAPLLNATLSVSGGAGGGCPGRRR